VFVFPQESQTSYVVVTAALEQPLQNFSVCLRSFTDLTRPYSLFSYATKKRSDDILFYMAKPNVYQFSVGGKSLFFTVPGGLAESEHVCASWESTTGIVGFWFNGKPWPKKGLQKGYTVGNEASIMLGNEGSTVLGNEAAGFMGEMSSMYLWDTGITNSGVLAAMDNRPNQTPVFGWRNFPSRIVGEVYLKP
ncbi:SAMP protein, partial [Grallaria varia]|nr:SAMP protein [Grallaria varia]